MNLLSYVFVAFELAAGVRLSELIQHGELIGRTEIGIIVVFLALPLLATLTVLIEDWRKKDSPLPPSSSTSSSSSSSGTAE